MAEALLADMEADSQRSLLVQVVTVEHRDLQLAEPEAGPQARLEMLVPLQAMPGYPEVQVVEEGQTITALVERVVRQVEGVEVQAAVLEEMEMVRPVLLVQTVAL